MSDEFATKLGMERCQACGHRWIDYEKVRGTCYMCGSTDITECVSLREVRETISALRKEDKKYLDRHAKRTLILKQLYREIAELSLQRAQEIYTKVKDHYTKGNLADKVLDQLIIAFRLFSDLGAHKSAAACAYMAAMGFAQRGADKEIRCMDDLNDLVAARQWFMRLGSKEWEAAVNLHIGQKSMAAVSTDSAFLQMMMQVSIWHFFKARDYFFEQHNTSMLDRIQFDIQRSTQLLTSYTQGHSQIEAARISSQSTLKHGESVRRGLESLGQSVQHGLTALGEHVDAASGRLGQAVNAASRAITANMAQAMYSLASRAKGRSLDKRMAEVGQLISTTAREVPEGYFQPVKELGAKFALGAVGSASTGDITNEPSVIKLAESVEPDARISQTNLQHVEEPSLRLTGTLLDTLIAKGMDKVNEEVEEEKNRESQPA